MEIIFDENRNEVFQGKKYQVIEMQASGDTNFTDIRKAAAKLVRDNKNNETVIIHPDSENKDVWLFAALLLISFCCFLLTDTRVTMIISFFLCL